MLTPEHLWNELVEEADEDPIRAAASVSALQAEPRPRAEGFDVTSERERANAVIARWNLGQPELLTRMARV